MFPVGIRLSCRSGETGRDVTGAVTVANELKTSELAVAQRLAGEDRCRSSSRPSAGVSMCSRMSSLRLELASEDRPDCRENTIARLGLGDVALGPRAESPRSAVVP